MIIALILPIVAAIIIPILSSLALIIMVSLLKATSLWLIAPVGTSATLRPVILLMRLLPWLLTGASPLVALVMIVRVLMRIVYPRSSVVVVSPALLGCDLLCVKLHLL